MAEKVEVLVDGGKATPGPPLGPVLGPLGVNVVKVVQAINERTRDFAGMKVPVKIVVEKDKSFTVSVGTPPTSALILKEVGKEKGAQKAKSETVGDLTMAQVKKIAGMKREELAGKDTRSAASAVIGTCVSMGVTVEGRAPRDVQKEIKEGKWDRELL